MARNRRLGGEYNRLYDSLKLRSDILNAEGKKTGVNWTALKMSDATGLRGLLTNYEGNAEDGLIHTSDAEPRPAKLKRLENDVAEIEQEHEKAKQQAISLGKPEPKEMNKTLLSQYHQALARLDIALEERDKLRKLLKEHETKEQAVQDEKLLKYGPVGSGVGDPLRSIDGQHVEKDENGELVIDDKRSRYHGMKVKEYRESIVQPFIKNRKKRNRAVSWANLPAKPVIEKEKKQKSA